jgi:hypothetical protein
MPMPKKPNENIRHSKRLTTVLPVDCLLIKLPDVVVSKHPLKPGNSFGGRTINISQNGLLINSDYELDPKTQVEITISLDKDRREAMKVLAEVAWAKRNAYDIYGRWAMGMRILEINPEHLKILETFFDPAFDENNHPIV